MERLTEHHVNKSLGAYMVCSMTCDNSICRVDCREILKIVDRLAAYEDTGLEPEEIRAVIDGSVKEFSEYDELMLKHRIKELAQAEKAGRLAVLPCKPGETAYQWKNGDDIPSLFRFDGVNINEDGEITYQTHWGETFTPDDFGKTIFLTREEAEAALKKREDVDNEAD